MDMRICVAYHVKCGSYIARNLFAQMDNFDVNLISLNPFRLNQSLISVQETTV